MGTFRSGGAEAEIILESVAGYKKCRGG